MAEAVPTKIQHGNLTRAGKGRPPGAKNKTTSSAKSIIEGVTDRLGGITRLTEWVQEAPENERVFWSSIFTKLIPVQVGGADDLPPIKAELSAIDILAPRLDAIRSRTISDPE